MNPNDPLRPVETGTDPAGRPDRATHQTAQQSDEMAKAKAAGFGQFAASVSASTGRDPLFGTSHDAPRIVEIALSEIDPNPDQPRTQFDPVGLEELAQSIREQGLIQPITVARRGDRYLLVAGERRYRAHQLLERDTIPAIITEGDPDIIALIENVQREGLDALDEATAYARLLEREGFSQGDLARIVGKKRNTISEIVSLTRLSPASVEVYRSTDTPPSRTVLVEIAKVEDEAQQVELLRTAIDGNLTVRAVRDERNTPSPTASKPDSVKAANARKDRVIRSLASTLKRLRADVQVDDFPAGSEALERIQAIKEEIDAQLAPLLDQARLPDKEK